MTRAIERILWAIARWLPERWMLRLTWWLTFRVVRRQLPELERMYALLDVNAEMLQAFGNLPS